VVSFEDSRPRNLLYFSSERDRRCHNQPLDSPRITDRFTEMMSSSNFTLSSVSMKNEFNSVYQQLNDLNGSTNVVRDFLRTVQGRSPQAKSEIQVSVNKDELIRNLHRSVALGFAKLSEVNQLLWDLEEIGRQHILLLVPEPDKLHLMEGSLVAEALFDEVDLTALFPRYEYATQGYLWADFRHEPNGGWLGKAYGREIYRQSQGLVSTEEMEDGTIQEIRQYALKEFKTTLVAKWRPSAKILEIRIDISNLQSEKTPDFRRDEMWQLLKPAFQKSDLVGLDIDKLLTKLISDREQPENSSSYSISRLELTDPRSGLIRVIPNQMEEIDKDPGRKESLEAMMRNGFQPSLVRLDWKVAENCPKNMTEPISVVIEKTGNGPEIRFLKRISNDSYEYIFDQLRSRLH
jgi:hypothetical protein